MANEIIAVTYTDDKDRDYVYGMNRDVFNQQNVAATRPLVGGSASPANSANPPLPASVTPRRALVANAAGKLRIVVLLEPDAPLYSSAVDHDISLEDSDGAASTFTFQKLLPESFGKKRRKQ